MSETVEDEKFAGKTGYTLKGELVVLLQVQEVAIHSEHLDYSSLTEMVDFAKNVIKNSTLLRCGHTAHLKQVRSHTLEPNFSTYWTTIIKLQLKLAAVINAAALFVRATYRLEGDGALDFFQAIHIAHFPNLIALSRKLSSGNATLAQQYEQYGHNCVQPGMQYFLTRFTQESMEAFKAFGAFRKVILVQPSSTVAEKFFSLLKATFSDQQDSALLDYLEASIMLQY